MTKNKENFDLPDGVVSSRWKERALKYEAALREIMGHAQEPYVGAKWAVYIYEVASDALNETEPK